MLKENKKIKKYLTGNLQKQGIKIFLSEGFYSLHCVRTCPVQMILAGT
jgi:hypothetical protein